MTCVFTDQWGLDVTQWVIRQISFSEEWMTSLFQWICGRCSETLFDEYYFNIQPSQTSLCRPGHEYAAGSGSECWHYFYCLSETFCEVLKPRCVFHQEETDPDKHNNSVWLTLFISTKCCLSCSFSHQVLKAFYCSRAAFKENSHLPFLLQLWGDFI